MISEKKGDDERQGYKGESALVLSIRGSRGRLPGRESAGQTHLTLITAAL